MLQDASSGCSVTCFAAAWIRCAHMAETLDSMHVQPAAGAPLCVLMRLAGRGLTKIDFHSVSDAAKGELSSACQLLSCADKSLARCHTRSHYYHG